MTPDPTSFQFKELEEQSTAALSEEDINEVLRFALESSQRSLNGQVQTLGSLRQRAMNIVGINGAILLLARTLMQIPEIPKIKSLMSFQSWTPANIFIVTVILSFLSSITLSLIILSSRSGWKFRVSGEKLLTKYIYSGNYKSRISIYSDFVGLSEKNYSSNERKLGLLHSLLVFSIISTIIHIGAWVIGGAYV